MALLEWATVFSTVNYVRTYRLFNGGRSWLLHLLPFIWRHVMQPFQDLTSLETKPPSRQQHMLARKSCLNIPYLALFGYPLTPLPRTFYHFYPNRTDRAALMW